MNLTVTTVSEILRYKPNANDDFLIGAGFCSRGGSVLVTGAPGCGKSKLAQHLMYSIALGMPFLGFTPVRSLRVLYLQNEDTMDDMHESLNGFIEQHGLGEPECSTIDKQCTLISVSGLSGDAYVCKVRELVKAYRPDIVITDPLLAFIGCDLVNQMAVSAFLRDGMTPILREFRCGWICIHHSSKAAIGNSGGSRVASGLGSIEIAAFFRGIIDIEQKSSDPTLLMIVVAKRWKQAGLRSADGLPTNKASARVGTGGGISFTLDTTASLPAKPKPVGSPPKAKKDEIAEFIAERRKDGMGAPALVKAVADHFKYSTKQARRYVTS